MSSNVMGSYWFSISCIILLYKFHAAKVVTLFNIAKSILRKDAILQRIVNSTGQWSLPNISVWI